MHTPGQRSRLQGSLRHITAVLHRLPDRASHRLQTTAPAFTNAKGSTPSAFTVFALCGGQSQLAALGYAPLPPNLVRDGLQQAAHIPGHGPIPTPAACH